MVSLSGDGVDPSPPSSIIMASWSGSLPTADAASAVADAATAASAAISSIDPSGIYSSNLVTSALSTIGDAQFFEESISPSTVRTQLVVTGDPSNPSTTLDLLKGMKWLLANMSKGRNVSDFFPHVVKLVGAPNLEVRKMVYIYLARYANHDSSCRELALLSINAFQRGLADREPLLRSLALRVLTCMDVPDVLQLQILGVGTCCKDGSPYVRKCAVNAVGKLHPRCLAAGDNVQAEQLVNIVTHLLEDDRSTMVLTSAMVAFSEICPERLDLLHGCYRKICHLLTDMDEWGQVVVIEALVQYCRTFFKQPRGHKKGSAENIDQERRVTRINKHMEMARGPIITLEADILSVAATKNEDSLLSLDDTPPNSTNGSSASLTPHHRQKTKRRIVRKAFYSDEEDESSEEEVDPNYPITRGNIAGTLREKPILGSPTEMGNTVFCDDVALNRSGERDHSWKGKHGVLAVVLDDEEDSDFDEDHKLLLDSSFPLLKSRNSAVVLAACSLHYHCGLASIKIRTALGKALVRIHRNRREIQYIVLVSIRTLVRECPSAFSPFLNDFFVKGMDPSFTRMIKVDILVSLCIDPKAIDTVLTELSTYVRHTDKAFACAGIRSIGKVAELARVVYDRRAQSAKKKLDILSARSDSNIIVLNCLSGLVTLSEFSRNDQVVGQCAKTIQRIFSQIWSDACEVNDPAGIQERALDRLLLILIHSLNPDAQGVINVDEEKTAEQTQLQLKTINVPDSAVASILWVVGEWLTREEKGKRKIRLEVLRLLAKSFGSLNPRVRLHTVHLASKVLLKLNVDKTSLSDTTKKEYAISELILAMARVDVMQDVRDRGRHESNILHMSIGLVYDASTLQQLPSSVASVCVDMATSILLHRKPSASSLPLDGKGFSSAKNESDLFRFGTLNSVMLDRTMGSAVPLPTWAEADSPSTLRDPSAASKSNLAVDGRDICPYSSSSDDASSSSSSEGISSSSSDDSSEDSDSESINTNKEKNGVDSTTGLNKPVLGPVNKSQVMVTSLINSEADEESLFDSSDDTSNASDNSEESDDSTEKGEIKPTIILDMESADLPQIAVECKKETSSLSSVAVGLEDLVMAPLVNNKHAIKPSTIDDESGAWKVLVRPELSGGLFVKMRFVYGRSRTKEARLLGIDPENSSSVCLQVHVENKRTEAGTLRHVRIVHRGGISRGMIFPIKATTPPEVPVLEKGMVSTIFIGITFSSASDRDGVVLAKFDVKSDRGTTSVEVRPTLGELLNDETPSTTSQLDFDAATSRLQGIQCISMCFTANFKYLTSTILKHLNLKQIGEWTRKGKGYFVGTLPSSGQEVYVAITCDSVTGHGNLTVCSNDAMAANSIMNLLKQALASQCD